MTRASSQDFLHSMRFHVTALGNNAYDPFRNYPQGGFNTCSTPEITVEPVEYKEGHMIYPQKYPGSPSMADVTLGRGVALSDTTFYEWALRVAEGSGDYRVDLTILHYHRDAMQGQHGNGLVPVKNVSQVADPASATPVRKYILKEAFVTRCKVAADLDATASDVSIAEMDVGYEFFEIQNTLTKTA